MLQKGGQLRACLFMAVEDLVAKGGLREVSLGSPAQILFAVPCG